MIQGTWTIAGSRNFSCKFYSGNHKPIGKGKWAWNRIEELILTPTFLALEGFSRGTEHMCGMFDLWAGLESLLPKIPDRPSIWFSRRQLSKFNSLRWAILSVCENEGNGTAKGDMEVNCPGFLFLRGCQPTPLTWGKKVVFWDMERLCVAFPGPPGDLERHFQFSRAFGGGKNFCSPGYRKP